MTIQGTAALISFAGIAAMVAVFLLVVARSGGEVPYADLQPKAYGIRRILFIVLLIGFFVIPVLTLRSMPYAAAELPDAIVVDVMAHQWYWTVSQQELPAGRLVVFRVSSADVNHGFAIYDEESRLIAQVQAMPGYTNHLAVEFEEPGSYRIMCLEYCGLVHHGMMSVLEVVDRPATQETL
jgi:cytochrome c oxidase subunit 2